MSEYILDLLDNINNKVPRQYLYLLEAAITNDTHTAPIHQVEEHTYSRVPQVRHAHDIRKTSAA